MTLCGSRSEIGGAKAALRDLKLQISKGEFEICVCNSSCSENSAYLLALRSHLSTAVMHG
jgi:hypothetical protein